MRAACVPCDGARCQRQPDMWEQIRRFLIAEGGLATVEWAIVGSLLVSVTAGLSFSIGTDAERGIALLADAVGDGSGRNESWSTRVNSRFDDRDQSVSGKSVPAPVVVAIVLEPGHARVDEPASQDESREIDARFLQSLEVDLSAQGLVDDCHELLVPGFGGSMQGDDQLGRESHIGGERWGFECARDRYEGRPDAWIRRSGLTGL